MKGKQYNKTYKVRPGYASFPGLRAGALFQFGRSVSSKQIVGLFIQLVIKEQGYDENKSNEGEYSK